MGQNGRDGGRVCTIKVTHSQQNGGVKGLMERLEKLSSQKVAVGIPGDKNKRENENGKKEEISNADLAYIHSHGVRPKSAREEMQPEINKGTEYSKVLQMYIHEHGSMAYQVPPRPIIEPAIENSKAQIGNLMGISAKAAADGSNIDRPLTDVGKYAESKVKNWFVDPKNGWPANAPSTIKAKGSDQPLVDTGALRKAITFVIREENND